MKTLKYLNEVTEFLLEELVLPLILQRQNKSKQVAWWGWLAKQP